MSMENMEQIQLLSDEELIVRYRAGDNQALAELAARYSGLADKKVAKYPFLKEEADDARQEALIAWMNAVKSYDAEKGASFRTYVSRCFDNAIKNFMIKSSAKKLQLLKQAVPFEELGDAKLEGAMANNPEEIYIDKERYHQLMEKIQMDLSEFERNVLFCYLDGKSYNQISISFNSSQKAVDNALQRVRRKLKTVLNQ